MTPDNPIPAAREPLTHRCAYCDEWGPFGYGYNIPTVTKTEWACESHRHPLEAKYFGGRMLPPLPKDTLL